MECHRLTCVDLKNKTAVCSVCGPVDIVSKGRGDRVCRNRWRESRKRWYATPKGKAYRRRHDNQAHREHVGVSCEACGYVAKVDGLLDGHHKDGNHKNNSAENIQTLCPICHRLTHLGRLDLVVKHAAKPEPDHNVRLLLEENERLTNALAERGPVVETNVDYQANYLECLAQLNAIKAKCSGEFDQT